MGGIRGGVGGGVGGLVHNRKYVNIHFLLQFTWNVPLQERHNLLGVQFSEQLQHCSMTVHKLSYATNFSAKTPYSPMTASHAKMVAAN